MENQNGLKRSDQIFYNMMNIRARSHLTTTMSFLSFFIVLEWSLSAILNAGKIRVLGDNNDKVDFFLTSI